ncbi:MAG: hypothetical protein AAGA58_03070 [Verrucomicrobiota bacterium]
MKRNNKATPRIGSTVVGILLLLIVLFLINEVDLSGLTDSSIPPELEKLTEPQFGERPPPSKSKQGEFTRLDGCTLAGDARSNDGDSFLLAHGPDTFHFRLYFVDCPEKYRHQYNGERIAEQGDYFGGLSESQTISVGISAQKLTRQILENARFSVWTRWERVYRSDRFYGLVEIQHPDQSPVFLHEILVRQGLGRIHTKGIDLPDGRTWRSQKQRLSKFETEAKTQALGGWKL